MRIYPEGWSAMRGQNREGARSLAPIAPQLFNRRARVIYEHHVGKDVAFACTDHEGVYFYCKSDQRNHPTRATELIFTKLADRLGIRTAPFAVVEHEGETYFGSQRITTSSDIFAVRDYLSTARFNEIGHPERFPGEYLAQVLAFDLFIGNPDRGANNFLIINEGGFWRICAIDFADADLASLTTDRFPVASSQTVVVGKRYRAIHGPHLTAALEMLDRIMSLPADAFSSFVEEVPEGWLDEAERSELRNAWRSPAFESRLALLRASIVDGKLV